MPLTLNQAQKLADELKKLPVSERVTLLRDYLAECVHSPDQPLFDLRSFSAICYLMEDHFPYLEICKTINEYFPKQIPIIFNTLLSLELINAPVPSQDFFRRNTVLKRFTNYFFMLIGDELIDYIESVNRDHGGNFPGRSEAKMINEIEFSELSNEQVTLLIKYFNFVMRNPQLRAIVHLFNQFLKKYQTASDDIPAQFDANQALATLSFLFSLNLGNILLNCKRSGKPVLALVHNHYLTAGIRWLLEKKIRNIKNAQLNFTMQNLDLVFNVLDDLHEVLVKSKFPFGRCDQLLRLTYNLGIIADLQSIAKDKDHRSDDGDSLSVVASSSVPKLHLPPAAAGQADSNPGVTSISPSTSSSTSSSPVSAGSSTEIQSSSASMASSFTNQQSSRKKEKLAAAASSSRLSVDRKESESEHTSSATKASGRNRVQSVGHGVISILKFFTAVEPAPTSSRKIGGSTTQSNIQAP